MESKCQKCFYYGLCDQVDYVIVEQMEITNNYCGIYERGIPNKIWSGDRNCKDFIEAE